MSRTGSGGSAAAVSAGRREDSGRVGTRETYHMLRRDAARLLRSAGVPDPDTDAELLLEYASSLSRTGLFQREREIIPDAVSERYRALVEKRQRRIPLQQITGTAWFMGFPFHVTDRVLIPRQDSEILAAETATCIRGLQKQGRGCGKEGRVRVLDLCTGSGCLIVSAARMCPGIEAVGTDISKGALDVARQNARDAGADVLFAEGDLFEPAEGSFDVILSNPPYIRSGEIPGLMEEVRDHEPHEALDGGEDGLFFYRRIADEAPDYLRKGGWLLLEIGADEGNAVSGLLSGKGFSDIRLIPDLSGLDRVVCGRYLCLKN